MMRIDYQGFGKRMRAARKALHMTQEELGAMLGVSKTTVGHLERGTKAPKLSTLISICYSLDISPNTLLFDSLPEDMFGEPVSPKIHLCQPRGPWQTTLTDLLLPELKAAQPDDDAPADLEQLEPIRFVLLNGSPAY